MQYVHNPFILLCNLHFTGLACTKFSEKKNKNENAKISKFSVPLKLVTVS